MTADVGDSSGTSTPQNNYRKQVVVEETRREPCVSGLSEILGHEKVKEVLINTIITPMYQPQLFTNMKVPNTLLLFGPPGTGKTSLVHAIAAQASAIFHCLTPSDVLSLYIGESEK